MKDPKKPKSGMYKTKARNLTDAQLKRAKGLQASSKRTVSISDTTRATTGANKGYTLGAGGKRFTGTVVMANGDRAVYKGGKRVTNAPKSSMKDKTPTRSTSGSRGSTGSGRAVDKRVAKPAKTRTVKGPMIAAGVRNNFSSANKAKAIATEKRRDAAMASRGSVSSRAGSKSSSGKSWRDPGGGGLVGPNSPLRNFGRPSSSKPKKGDRKRVGGAYGGYATYDGTRWVKSK